MLPYLEGKWVKIVPEVSSRKKILLGLYRWQHEISNASSPILKNLNAKVGHYFPVLVGFQPYLHIRIISTLEKA